MNQDQYALNKGLYQGVTKESTALEKVKYLFMALLIRLNGRTRAMGGLPLFGEEEYELAGEEMWTQLIYAVDKQITLAMKRELGLLRAELKKEIMEEVKKER